VSNARRDISAARAVPVMATSRLVRKAFSVAIARSISLDCLRLSVVMARESTMAVWGWSDAFSAVRTLVMISGSFSWPGRVEVVSRRTWGVFVFWEGDSPWEKWAVRRPRLCSTMPVTAPTPAIHAVFAATDLRREAAPLGCVRETRLSNVGGGGCVCVARATRGVPRDCWSMRLVLVGEREALEEARLVLTVPLFLDLEDRVERVEIDRKDEGFRAINWVVCAVAFTASGDRFGRELLEGALAVASEEEEEARLAGCDSDFLVFASFG